MKLKRTKQCAKCPWKKKTNPLDIPNGYDIKKHESLSSTIAEPSKVVESIEDYANNKPLNVMACHEEHQAHCVGWLNNQLGVGNNVVLRIKMLSCENIDQMEIFGEQHETFEETIPKT